MSSSTSDRPRLDRRVALVTGGTRGIGLAISEGLARDGLAVAMVYRRDEAAARAAQERLEALGARAMVLAADVGQQAEAARAVRAVTERWGRLDVVVNNAGVFDFALLDGMEEAFLDELLRANFKSMVFTIQAALPWLKAGDHARVLNASSISGRLADVGLIAYAASKASADMLTRIAAAELAPSGITVNAYAPGIVFTEMTRGMIEARGDQQVKQIPAGRFGVPEDVAGLIRYLCSPAADYVTGEVIGVDGGMLKVQNPHRARRG